MSSRIIRLMKNATDEADYDGYRAVSLEGRKKKAIFPVSTGGLNVIDGFSVDGNYTKCLPAVCVTKGISPMVNTAKRRGP